MVSEALSYAKTHKKAAANRVQKFPGGQFEARNEGRQRCCEALFNLHLNASCRKENMLKDIRKAEDMRIAESFICSFATEPSGSAWWQTVTKLGWD